MTELTVTDIARHLGLKRWQVVRRCGTDIPGRKVSGPGHKGRGGQWRIPQDEYLAWLKVPYYDMPVDGSLPEITSLAALAADAEVDRNWLIGRWRRDVIVGRVLARDVLLPPTAAMLTKMIAAERKAGAR